VFRFFVVLLCVILILLLINFVRQQWESIKNLIMNSSELRYLLQTSFPNKQQSGIHHQLRRENSKYLWQAKATSEWTHVF